MSAVNHPGDQGSDLGDVGQVSILDEEVCVYVLYCLANAHKDIEGDLDLPYNKPRFSFKFADDLYETLDFQKVTNTEELLDSVESFVNKCKAYEDIIEVDEVECQEWLYKYDWDEYSDSLKLRKGEDLRVVLEKAVKHSEEKGANDDDLLKKRCRLIVRFFRTAYTCKYQEEVHGHDAVDTDSIFVLLV